LLYLAGVFVSAVGVLLSTPFILALSVCLLLGGVGLMARARWGAWLSIAALWPILCVCSWIPAPVLGMFPLLALAVLHSSAVHPKGRPGPGDWLVGGVSGYRRSFVRMSLIALGMIGGNIGLYLVADSLLPDSVLPIILLVLVGICGYTVVFACAVRRRMAAKGELPASCRGQLVRRATAATGVLFVVCVAPFVALELTSVSVTALVVSLAVLAALPELTMRLVVYMANAVQSCAADAGGGALSLSGNRGLLFVTIVMSMVLSVEGGKLWAVGAVPGLCIAAFWVADAAASLWSGHVPAE
jgi:hypothetical protein